MNAERSSLVGRERETEVVLGLLEREDRVVTLVGPGGVGKTRLALRVASRRAEARPAESAYRVDLRGARGAEEAAALVATALGSPIVDTAAMPPRDQVGLTLADRGPVLLVLDDFDHLVPAAEATIGRWLSLAPELRCLVTSRQALGIQDELRHEVAPLPIGDALALFVARVQAAAPGFVATGAVRDTALEIVRRLDCLPLAIELAAARSVVLAPEEILGRLDRRLDLLQVSDADRIGARHSSLRAALEWSWSLLSDGGRGALAALSVFEGGFTVDAACAVIGAGDAGIDELASLRERSLIAPAAHQGDGRSRFDLLESVRELAAEKLAERGEREAAEARHAAFFLSAAARGGDGERALAWLRREAGNLVRAGQASLERDPVASVRIALALGEALALSGPPAVQIPLLDDAVRAAGALDPALHARALLLRGDARAICGRRAEAATDLEDAARAARSAGDRLIEGQVLRRFGILRRDDGDFAAARAHLERAASVIEACGDRSLLGHAIANLATLHRQEGRVSAARTHYQRALELHRDTGERGGQGLALAGLGHLDAAAGRPAEATASYQEALEHLSAVGDRRTIAVVSDRLALLAIGRGDPAAALPLLEAAVADLVAVGDRRLAAVVGAHRAIALGLIGRHGDAATALAAAARTIDHLDDARIAAALRLARAWLDLLHGPTSDRPASVERAVAAATADERSLSASPGEKPYVEYLSDLKRALDDGMHGDGAAPPADPGAAIGRLEVRRRGAWARVDDARPLRLAPLLARLLDALVEERLARPGQPLRPEELAVRLWPGETLTPKLAAERVHGVVARLRRLGLETALIRRSGGYFLHQGIHCTRADG